MATTYVNQQGEENSWVVYDTVAGVQGADADHSRIINTPQYVQVQALAAGTSVQLQHRIHADATWVNVGSTITSVEGATVVKFIEPANFVQIVRTGAGAVKAFAQD